MSGQKASTSGMAGSSGGTPTYNAEQVRANRTGKLADQYAQKKLGITTTMAGPVAGANTTPTAVNSTTSSNQMYGSEYSSARNEYLANQGLGTVRADGGFMTGVQTDKGLTFTSAARDAYNASRDIAMPLSRQMYDSQQKFKTIAGALATGISGMPSFFSAAYYSSKKPYSQYVADYYSGSKRGVQQSTNVGNNTQSNNASATELPDPAPEATTNTASIDYRKAFNISSANANSRVLLGTNSTKTISGKIMKA